MCRIVRCDQKINQNFLFNRPRNKSIELCMLWVRHPSFNRQNTKSSHFLLQSSIPTLQFLELFIECYKLSFHLSVIKIEQISLACSSTSSSLPCYLVNLACHSKSAPWQTQSERKKLTESKSFRLWRCLQRNMSNSKRISKKMVPEQKYCHQQP